MYGLELMNAAGHGHHRSHHHNRQEGGEPTKKEADEHRKHHVGYFIGQKLAEGVVGSLLGYIEGHGGEPMFFSSDPSKAVGLKALGALITNAIEFARIWFSHSFGKYGVGGSVFDGVACGTASAFWVAWCYDNANTYGSAKRAAEAKTAASGGVDYSKTERQLPPKQEQQAPGAPQMTDAQAVAIRDAQRRASQMAADPFADLR